MLPSVQIFGKSIAMYGLMIAIGFIAGVGLAVIRSKKYSIPKEDVFFASCYAGIGLIVGAKLLYIITVLPKIIEYREIIFSDYRILLGLISGGFVFYGGLIGAILGIYIYCRQFHINLLGLVDLLGPSIPLIHAFGRIGCYLAGCCYGIHYDGPLHIVFENSSVGLNGVPLFPIQLLESVLNFIAAGVLLIYARKPRKTGRVIGSYLIYYTIARFVLEFLRGDIERGFLLGISTSQWISLLLLPLAIWIFNGATRPVKKIS